MYLFFTQHKCRWHSKFIIPHKNLINLTTENHVLIICIIHSYTLYGIHSIAAEENLNSKAPSFQALLQISCFHSLIHAVKLPRKQIPIHLKCQRVRENSWATNIILTSRTDATSSLFFPFMNILLFSVATFEYKLKFEYNLFQIHLTV